MVGRRDTAPASSTRPPTPYRQPGLVVSSLCLLTALMNRFQPETPFVVDGPVCIGNWVVRRNYGHSYPGRGGTLTQAIPLDQTGSR